eukprot:CAMPEP_0113463008 /NCGR_PEP_ID=MMETSP0014_2-20120614/12412_1 /TAXON_ID=2857 /ORGANISM="Nitzschia sp." /LENGTH=862 /DNA_ID=CAMNT_0000354941 /DNA_START=296 /DNA_END=2884 /DNA_ORIENTATION=+ /assembly_acc=CAM_ASM_000159
MKAATAPTGFASAATSSSIVLVDKAKAAAAAGTTTTASPSSATDLVSASSVSSASAASSSSSEEEQQHDDGVSPVPSRDDNDNDNGLQAQADEEDDKWHLEWDSNSNSTKGKAAAAASTTTTVDDDDDEASTSTTSTTTATPTAAVAATTAAVTVVRLRNNDNETVDSVLNNKHLIVMDSKLYDVSQVMGWHPGGREVIDFYCCCCCVVRDGGGGGGGAAASVAPAEEAGAGSDRTAAATNNTVTLSQVIDATDAFRGYHPAYVNKMLRAYHVGDVVAAAAVGAAAVQVAEGENDKQQPTSSSTATDANVEAAFLQDYRALTSQFESEGLFEINTTYFHVVLARCFAMLGVAVYYTTAVGSSLWQQLFVGAPLLGLFIQQVLLLGHDAGHNGITHSRNKDKWYGWLFGPVLTGISMVWWKHNHNIHHVMTNSVEHDVDLTDVMPVFATQPSIYESHWKKNASGASSSASGGAESRTAGFGGAASATATTTTTTSSNTGKKKKNDDDAEVATTTTTSASSVTTTSTSSSSTPPATTTTTTSSSSSNRKKLDRLAQLDFLSEKLSRFLVKYQHLTFFPIMFFYARINLHFKGYGYALGQLGEVLSLSSPPSQSESSSSSSTTTGEKSRQYRNERLQDVVMDMVGCVTYWCWMTQLVSRNLDGVLAKVAFVLVVHAVAGLIHIQICINHFPMPAFKHLAEEQGDAATAAAAVGKTATDTTAASSSTDDDDDDDSGIIDPTCWPAMHLNGTMDVDCPPYMDWFHGGLQFQVEHHLWPRIPRHNLRKIKQRTIDLCGRHLTSKGRPVVKYEAMPLMKAVVYLYKHMEEVAEQVQQLPTDGGQGRGQGDGKVPNFYDSITYKAACLDG